MSLIQKMTAIMKAVINDPEYGFEEGDWDFWEKTFLCFIEYVNIVVRMETLIPLYRFRYDGDELKTRIMELDKTRRIKHEAMLTNVNILNRQCDKYGIERFIESTEDRYKVAELAGRLVGEVYFNSIGMSVADVVLYADGKEYDGDMIRKTLRNAA